MSAWPELAAQALQAAGPVGASDSWTDEICATWPATAAERPHGPWNAKTAVPILVVGNTDDPSTPLQNAQAMSKLLADARLLVVDGYGHTALLNPSTCANQHMVAYLVIDETLPAEGTTCPQDTQPFAAS